MDEFFNNPVWGGGATVASLDVNVKEHSDKVVVEARIPGFTKDEVSINVEDNMLIIEGHKKEEKEEGEEDGTYYMKEYTTQSVKRSVTLPSKVDGEKAEAAMKDGILKVTLPKLPEVMPKKIEIKAS